MNEQLLHEAAIKHAGPSIHPEDTIEKIETFEAGAKWHEQQNTWRKVEDELPCRAPIWFYQMIDQLKLHI